MNITLLLIIIFAYFIVLLGVAYYTSRNSDNQSFFIGNRKSSWWLVAFGMIGTSLSGVTFISVPGTVGKVSTSYAFGGFEYFQLILGNFIGYVIVAMILLPLYYKMNLTSIYTYLSKRFNTEAHKTGSAFFIISRAIGATARLYLVINVLDIFLLKSLGVPFWATTVLILLMILLYTFEGGVKTIVFTDTLQTSFMLISLIACILFVLKSLNLDFIQAIDSLNAEGYLHTFNFDYHSGSFFLKHILGGMFITIAMTGLDQEMMQKNISVKNLRDSKKNMLTFATVLLLVNFLFLFMGGLLYLYAMNHGAEYEVYSNGDVIKNIFGFSDSSGAIKNIMGDNLFPTLSLGGYFPQLLSIIFIIGLVSALFPSADGALTSLTSSFCVDILGLPKKQNLTEKKKKMIRIRIHLIFTFIFLLLILVFKKINNESIVYIIMDLAGFTYGPLLGLFAFGIFTKKSLPKNGMIFTVCLIAPIISYLSRMLISKLGYGIGLELIILNSGLTFLGLLLISQNKNKIKI
ncbi:sodium:solute symporter [Apibacter raozihei]|uniref:sodium:solute symporter n=1 Tax=Apibacter raozihei TaxID=2500547 RepID=UPI000FE32EE2|nr:sodium:solute symporter [Apibacter raozihei]